MDTTFLVQPTVVDKESPGIVYVLINEAMPGIVKIGMTAGDLAVRIKQLDTTGVPLPFECVLAVRVKHIGFIEQRIHRIFYDRRVRASREFFRVGLDSAKSALKLVAGVELSGVDVTPKQDIVESADDQAALDAAKKRRSRFDFTLVGIKPGKVLTSTFNSETTCTVYDNRSVRFRDDVRSLSDAALEVAREHGFLWKAVQGPRFWKYNGVLLDELRNDALGADEASDAKTA